MKKTRLIFGMALALGMAAMSFPARAGWDFRVGFPVIPFGVGFGAGFAWAYPYYSYGYPAPAYSYYYAPPANYFPEANYLPPAGYVPSAAVVADAPMVSGASSWVPCMPGAGHWVPDPQPYRYTSAAPVQTVAPSGQCVLLTTSTYGVPLSVISQVK